MISIDYPCFQRVTCFIHLSHVVWNFETVTHFCHILYMTIYDPFWQYCPCCLIPVSNFCQCCPCCLKLVSHFCQCCPMLFDTSVQCCHCCPKCLLTQWSSPHIIWDLLNTNLSLQINGSKGGLYNILHITQQVVIYQLCLKAWKRSVYLFTSLCDSCPPSLSFTFIWCLRDLTKRSQI